MEDRSVVPREEISSLAETAAVLTNFIMLNEQIVLRNFPANPLFDQKQYPKSLAFSPDIIPLYGASPSVSALLDDHSFGGFIGMPLVPYDDNYIYVRGVTHPDAATSFQSAVTLRVVPSELILWPQVWNEVSPVSSGPVVIPCGVAHWFERVASSRPFKYRPSHGGGIGHSLIVQHSTLPLNIDKTQRLRDSMPSPPKNITNCKDYYNFVTTDTNVTYYSVLVADPTSAITSVTTRLRIFDDDPYANVTVMVSVVHGGVPNGTQVSLTDDRGQINVPRTGISDASAKPTLKHGYDGLITMNVFAPENTQFDPYSWISLRVSLIASGGALQTLGALNIMFEPDSTRNIRFSSPAAVNARNAQAAQSPQSAAGGVGGVGAGSFQPLVLAGSAGAAPTSSSDPGPIPITAPAATGWWFRDNMGDVNIFPRGDNGLWSNSPDVEFAGNVPLGPHVFSDPNVDYTIDNQVSLTPDPHNYVYVRGHSTLPDIAVETRLWLTTNAGLLHPSFYAMAQNAVKDPNGKVAMRTLRTTPGSDFFIFDEPFDLGSVPNPGGNHYCLIGEARQRRIDSWDDPSWPHEQHEEFATTEDFGQWVASCSLVCWRNIAWTPCSPHMCFCVEIIIPIGCPCCVFWTIVIECFNATPNSCWQLACDGPVIPGLVIGWDKRPVGASNASWGCHFTGVPGGYHGKLTLEWFSDTPNVPDGLSFKYHLGKAVTGPMSPSLHFASPPVPGNGLWPFHVGNQYPNISGTASPSLVPEFKNSGVNVWPYPNAKYIRMGGDHWQTRPAH